MQRLSLLILLLACCAANALAAEVPSGDVFGGIAINHTATSNNSINFTG